MVRGGLLELAELERAFHQLAEVTTGPPISGPSTRGPSTTVTLLSERDGWLPAAWAGIEARARAETATAEPAAIRAAVFRVFFTFISSYVAVQFPRTTKVP